MKGKKLTEFTHKSVEYKGEHIISSPHQMTSDVHLVDDKVTCALQWATACWSAAQEKSCPL